MTNDDRLFAYRLQLFAHAERTSVAEACRVFSVHRSTYYAWKKRVERHGKIRLSGDKTPANGARGEGGTRSPAISGTAG